MELEQDALVVLFTFSHLEPQSQFNAEPLTCCKARDGSEIFQYFLLSVNYYLSGKEIDLRSMEYTNIPLGIKGKFYKTII